MATLQYDFRVVGLATVKKALASIESRVAQHNAKIARMTGGTRRTGSPIAAAQKSAQQTSRAVLTEEMRVQRQIDAVQEKRHRRRVRRAINASKEITRNELREAKKRAQADIKAAKAAAEARRRFARGVGSRVGKSVTGSISAVGAIGAGALSLGGGYAVAGAVQNQIDEGKRASELANQAGRPEIKGQLLKESRQNAGYTGMETLEALGQFTDVTGDLETARKIMPELSRIALATGTSLDDLAAAAANAFVPLADSIDDPVERLKELQKVIRTMAGQGQIGAVEIKDLATEMASLAAASNKFQGSKSELIGLLGAIAQMARQKGGAPTAAEAVTATERFTSDIVGNNKGFKALGVQTMNAEGTELRAPDEILIDTLKATKGKLEPLGDLFGIYAQRAVGGFAPAFNAAEQANAALPKDQQEKFGEAGARAVREIFKKQLEASLSDEAITKQSESRLSDADLQFKEALKKFNEAMGSQMLPAITRLIPKFVELIPLLEKGATWLAKFVSDLADNPLAGIGKIVAAKVALDLGSAGIGAGAKAAITKALSAIKLGGGGGGGGGGPGAPAVPGGAGKGFRAGVNSIGLGAATAAAAVGIGLAMDQADKLSNETGGLGVTGTIGEMWKRGTWNPFEAVDAYQDEQAKREALFREQSKPDNPMQPQNWVEVQPSNEASKKQIDAATRTANAADKLERAADKLTKVQINRTDRPSPVK